MVNVSPSAARPIGRGTPMEPKAENNYLALYDLGCRYPECECYVPYWAMSQEPRRRYCVKAIGEKAEKK